jgi:DNA polymerase-1
MERAKINLGASDWSRVPLSPEQLEYAIADVVNFPILVPVLTDALKSAMLWDCFRERSEFFIHLNNIKFAGLPVNLDRLLHDAQKCEGLKLQIREDLKELFKDFRPPVPKSRRKKTKLVAPNPDGSVVLTAETETEEFNPNAHAQILAALAMHGIEVPDSKVETLLAVDSLETRKLIEYKEQTSLLTIINGIRRSVFDDSRVRAGGWNQLAARTGRIHSIAPNLQNLPRDWRLIFEAPDPYLWLKIDLSQIEIYILAIHCQDTNLLSMLAADKDIYVELAAELFGRQPISGNGSDEVNDALRSVAKTLTLGIAYCLGPRSFIRRVKFKTGLEFEVEEAKDFFEKFFAMFPQVKVNQDQALEDATTQNCVFTVTGQRRFLPPLKNDLDEFTGYWPSLEFRKRVLVNTPIQGGAANLFIRAINRFAPRLPTPAEIVNLVHDEVNLLVTQESAEDSIAIITTAFQESFAELFGTQLKVKLDHKLCKSWGGPGEKE